MPWRSTDRDVTTWNLLSSRRIADRPSANVIYSLRTRPFDQIDAGKLSPTAAFALLEPWRDWEQRECVAVFRGKAFIEPSAGWIVCSPGHLLLDQIASFRFSWPSARARRLSAAVEQQFRLFQLRRCDARRSGSE